ncbi:MAG: LacI family DNA-binding transcriptional regulator [Lachnospiraceae bacterium]|nr:LacI family DNA-binding transcriptional regulator [Lachnospiraceae bacterium]
MGRRKSKVTVQDIAQKANISTATVSRAFNGTGIVKPETYQLIMETAKELGYVFKPFKAPLEAPPPAENQKKNSRKLILVHVTMMSNPFYSEIIKGIESSAKNNNFEFLLYSEEITPATVDSFLELVSALGISGLITLYLSSVSLLQKITEFIPVVQCCECTENPYASSVGINDYAATQCAMDYFLSMGKNRIGFINGPLSYKYSQARLKAFRSIMQTYNIDIPAHWIIQLPDLNYDMAFSSIVKVLSMPDAPDCFFAVSDVLAAAAIRAAQYYALRVPEDILVIGFDNTIVSQLTTPSITTISQPQFQLGFLAGELMFEKISNPLSEVKHMKLNTELIIRESTSSTI